MVNGGTTVAYSQVINRKESPSVRHPREIATRAQKIADTARQVSTMKALSP
jgi:hypothetical protein